jgi:hypothetical protein
METFELYPFLAKRVGQSRILVVDGECVETAGDYERLIEDLLSLSTIPLALDHFESTDTDPRVLQPTIAGVSLTFTVEGDTDWVDSEAFVAGLNSFFAQKGLDFRFYAFYDVIRFGQETGFCFLEKNQGDALLAELRALTEQDGGYFGFFTDGTDGIGTEYETFEDDDDEEDWDDEWEDDEEEYDDDDEEEGDDDDEDDDEDDDVDWDEEDDDSDASESTTDPPRR